MIVEHPYRIPLYPDVGPHGEGTVAAVGRQQPRSHYRITAVNSQSREITPLRPFEFVGKCLVVFQVGYKRIDSGFGEVAAELLKTNDIGIVGIDEVGYQLYGGLSLSGETVVEPHHIVTHNNQFAPRGFGLRITLAQVGPVETACRPDSEQEHRSHTERILLPSYHPPQTQQYLGDIDGRKDQAGKSEYPCFAGVDIRRQVGGNEQQRTQDRQHEHDDVDYPDSQRSTRPLPSGLLLVIPVIFHDNRGAVPANNISNPSSSNTTAAASRRACRPDGRSGPRRRGR